MTFNLFQNITFNKKTNMFKNTLLLIFINSLLFLSCGSESSTPPTTSECSNVSFSAEGVNYVSGEVLGSSIVQLTDSNILELILVFFTASGDRMDFQVIQPLNDPQICPDLESFNLETLPDDQVVVCSFFKDSKVYSAIGGNVFPSGSGVFEFTSCDSANKTFSANFNFIATTGNGESISITNGKIIDQCFETTK